MKKNIEEKIILFFDKNYYLKKYPDVAKSQIEALSHYVKLGWQEGRQPNTWYGDHLVPAKIRQENPQVPCFILFLGLHSIDELREIAVRSKNKTGGHEHCWACEIMRPHFESEYYYARYPDIPNQTDALSHFCEIGWTEERSPSLNFDTKYYIQANPDVKDAGVNPFIHYLTEGLKEGRKSKSPSNTTGKLLRALKTIERAQQEYLEIAPRIKISPLSSFQEPLLLAASRAARIVISLSHDNYLRSTGGIQKFLHGEQKTTSKEGGIYLHLYPTRPGIQILHGSSSEAFLLNASIDGTEVGTFTAKEVCETLSSISSRSKKCSFTLAVHSLMGWDASVLDALCVIKYSKKYFMAHDYAPLCTEYRLLRNNVVPCDAPPLGSEQCKVCAHGSSRPAMVRKYQDFFSRLKPQFIYPSKCCAEIYSTSQLFPEHRGAILPHIKVEKAANANPSAQRVKENELVIAFCGAPVLHKGYEHFSEIVDTCRTERGIRFVHIGVQPGGCEGLTFYPQGVGLGERTMTDAIRKHKVDVIFLGSTCRETFNFVAIEAAQAGAAIITLANSGNVADLTKNFGLGYVASNTNEIVQLIQSNDFLEKVLSWQREVAKLNFTPLNSFYSLEENQ